MGDDSGRLPAKDDLCLVISLPPWMGIGGGGVPRTGEAELALSLLTRDSGMEGGATLVSTRSWGVDLLSDKLRFLIELRTCSMGETVSRPAAYCSSLFEVPKSTPSYACIIDWVDGLLCNGSGTSILVKLFLLAGSLLVLGKNGVLGGDLNSSLFVSVRTIGDVTARPCLGDGGISSPASPIKNLIGIGFFALLRSVDISPRKVYARRLRAIAVAPMLVSSCLASLGIDLFS